jgi:hypothetical protein
MPRRKVSGEATHQEAPGATIVAPDKATYVRRHAAFSPSRPPAGLSATRREQLPTMWTGASRLAPSATEVTACSLAVHNVDSSFSQDRPAPYAPARRRTLNQNQKPEEELHPYHDWFSSPQPSTKAGQLQSATSCFRPQRPPSRPMRLLSSSTRPESAPQAATFNRHGSTRCGKRSCQRKPGAMFAKLRAELVRFNLDGPRNA